MENSLLFIFGKIWPKSLYYSTDFTSILIHMDVLMLCSKFELIPTSIFRVMTTFLKLQILEKYPVLL